MSVWKMLIFKTLFWKYYFQIDNIGTFMTGLIMDIFRYSVNIS